MSTKPFSFEEAQKPVDPASPATQPKTFSFEEASGVSPDGAFARGWNKTKQSATITGRLLSGDAQGAAQTIKEADDYARRNPGMAEGRDLSAAWQRGDGVMGGISEVAGEFAKDWRDAPSVVGGIRATAKNVRAMGEGIVEQVPNMIAPTVGLLGGTAVGGAAGSAVPIVGNVAGGLVGGWAGASAGNALVEGGGMAQEAIQKAGINPQDTAAVEKYLKGQGDGILTQAGIKGGIIGAVDVATMGIASKLLNGPARAATTRALADMGVDVSNKAAVNAAINTREFATRFAGDATYKAAMTGAGNVARNAGAAALDPAGEFTGELVGQGAATGDWDTKNAALEAFSSIGQSGVMFTGQKAYQAATRPRTGDAAASPEATQETPPPGLSPEQLAAWNEARLSELQDQEQVEPLGPQSAAPDGRAILDAQRAANRAEMSPDDEIYQSTGYADPSRPRPQFADTIASRLKPSEVMGLNPAAGALSREVAAFVDAQPFTEVTPIEQRTGIGAQRRLGEQPIIDVDAREVIDPQSTIAARLAGPSQSAPLQQAVAQLPYNPATQGDSLADQAPQAIQAATQRTQAGAAQAEPALTDGYGRAWDSLDTETRTSVARSAGARGVLARNVASKGWGDLSPNLRSSISTAIESARSSGAPAIQLGNQPQGASNVGNATAPQAGSVPATAGAPNALSQGERGVGLSGNGDGVGGRLDGAGQRIAGAGFGEAGIAPVAGRPGVAPALTQGTAPILQNRNRSNPSSIAQMQGIAAAPDYGRLGFSRDFANGAPVVAGGTVPADHVGRSDVAVASDGRRIPVQYAVVEASDVLASNQVDGTPNADYGNQSVTRIRAIAGNGRIAGLQRAYVMGTSDGYAGELLGDALHGVNPDVIRSMRQPVLVRVMPVDQVTQDIGDVSNTTGNLSLSPVEQANNDAQRVSLDALQFSEDGAITSDTVRQFVRAMPQAEQGGLIDTNGQPTKQAVDRINAAVFARAYGNDQLIRLFAQAQDPEVRNVLSALAQVAPKMARLEGAGSLDIRDVVTQAAEIAVNARREGRPLANAASQIDMTADPMVGEVLKLFARNARTVRPVVDALGAAADFAYTEANKPAEDMFGAVPKATRSDVLGSLSPQNEQASQANLEQPAGGKPVQVDAVQPAADAGAATDAAATQAGRPAEAEGLTSPTRADIEAQQDRAEQADALDAKAQAKRESEVGDSTFMTGLTGDGRQDNTADLFSQQADAERDIEQEYQDLKAEANKWLSRDAEYEGRDFGAEYAAVRDLEGQEFIDAVTPILDEFKAARARFFAPNRAAIEQMQENERSTRANLPQQTDAEAAFDGSPERAIQAMTPVLREAVAKELGIKRGKKTETAFIEALAAWPRDQVRAAYLAVMQSTKPTATIEDFGERLEGARKFLPPSLQEDIGDDQIASLPLSKVWPSDAHESIEDDSGAALTFAARQEIPAKPRVAYKVRGWVEKVKTFRRIVRDFDGASIELMEKLAQKRGYDSLAPFFAKVKLLTQLPRDTWGRIEKVGEYPDARRGKTAEELRASGLESRPFDKDKLWLGGSLYRIDTGEPLTMDQQQDEAWVANPFSSVTIDGKTHSFDVGRIGPDEVQKVRELLGSDAPKKGGLTASDFEVRGSAKSGYKINRKGDSEYRALKTFTGEGAAKKALAWRDENVAELEAAWEAVKARDNVSKADVRRDENRERLGENRRDGKDVTPEMFEKALGFRGVQFGNWVAQGKGAKDRQGLLNEAYDAMLDLADVLGIPPRAVSLNGSLGLSLGARGAGKASAHFEPSNLVINLTKTRGAGTLAHEWFHALDNYFSRLRGGEVAFTGDQAEYRRSNYITYKPEAAWVKTMGARFTLPLTSSQLRAKLQQLGGAQYDPSKTIEQNAKDAGWQRDPKHKEGVRPEVERAFVDLVQALNESPMAKRASAMDKAGSDGYWGRIIERGARSFENYVINKLAQRGWSNDFLANVRDWKEWEQIGKNSDRYPYLRPDEEAPIVAAFDALFDVVETRETEDGNVAMFSRTGDRAGLADGWAALADSDGIAQSPTSDSKEFAEVMSDVAPGFVIEPQQATPEMDSAWKIYPEGSPDKYGFVMSYKDGRVELNVPRLREGDGGASAYVAVGNWAMNTGRKFAADRYGISRIGAARRLENLASMAIKFGTAKFIDAPSADMGVKWGGDDAANIESLLSAAHDRIRKALPEIDNYAYDFKTRQFVSAAQGNARVQVPGDLIASLVDQARKAGLSAGRSTIQRAILTGTLKRGEALLSSVREIGRATAPDNLKGTLYQRGQGAITTRDSDAQLTAAQQITDAIAARWQNAPADIIVARNMQDASIPEAVRKHDAELKSQGATGEPRGFIYKGKVYLLSDQLKTTSDVIEVLFHESLGHYGLRGVFGDSLKSILQQVGTMRRADVVAKAREYGLFDADKVGENASDRDVWASMTDKQRLDAAEEVLAEMSQTRPDLGFVQRAISAIRNWLRTNVPGFQNLRMKDADIVQAYLLPARGWVERGGVSSSVNRQVANEPGARYSAREQDLLFSGDEAPTSGRPGYETDLFGDPLPISAGRLAPARPARTEVRGDAQPTTGLSDTAAPEGSYRVRTIIGQEVSRKLGADTILTPEQAAQATAYLYRSAVERFDAIVTDKNGKPLAVVGSFKGALTQTSIYPGTIIAEAVRVPGAARIWFSHNHPSGKSALSDADKTLNRTLSSVFDGTSIEPMGTLAVTGKSFEHVSPDGLVTSGATPAPSASINVPVIERELDPGNKDADIILDSPAKAREHGSALYRDAGEPGLMILDAQHRVAAWVPVRGAMKGKLMGTGGLDAVYRAVSESNAGSVIIIHGGELDAGRGDGNVWSIAQNLGAALRGTDVRVLDIIDVNKPRSAAETGADLVARSVFSRTQGATPAQPAAPAATTSTAAPASAWGDLKESAFDDVILKTQDKMIDLKRVVESITKSVGAVADNVNAYLQEELFHGRAASRVAEFGNREMKPLMNQMRLAGLTLEDVEEFLHARHAKEANAVIAQRNPGNADMQDGGSGMTNADADAYFANLAPGQRSKLEAAAKKVDAIIADTRKLYVQYGLEDQAVVDGWTGMFKSYIPLMRENKDGGMGIGQGFSVKGKEVKGRTGSKRKVVNIMANVMAQREKVIVRGEKNRVAQALVGLAWANPNKAFWEVRSQAPTERVYDDKLKKVVDRPDPMFKSRDNVLSAKVKDSKGNVTEQFVVFNEDNPRAVRLASAMKNLDAGNLEGLLGVSAKITRYFSAINTQYNPVFGVVNLVRDVQGAMVNLAATPLAGEQAKIAKDTISALSGIYGDIRKTRKGGQATSPWAKLWEQMQEDGGTTGYRELFKTSADREASLKAIINPDAWMDSKWGKVFTADGKLKVPMSVAKEKAGDLFNWLSDYNEAMENGVRLAAYKAALDKGMSRQQAASLSKNLTVNFNRKGQAGMQAGAVYAFFNAAMQGTARIGQTLFDMEGGDIKTIRLSSVGKKVVYGGVLLGVMQALALSAAGFDDEDPPEFLRERSLIIPTGGKTYISIPMPLGLHVIPGLGRHATEFALSGFSKPAERAVSVVGMLADAFNPIGNAGLSMQTVAPTALDPFVALSENRDWTGKPIARTSFNKAEPGHNQWKDTATGFSKTIAEAINWLSGGNEYVAGAFSPTPDQIDYLIAQVGGGVAREVSKVMQTGSSITSGEELPTYKMPLLGRFVGSANGQASQGSAFYANLNKLNALETEIKGLRKDGKYEEAAALVRERPESSLIAFANKAERDVQKLRRDKRELIANDADRDAVRAKEDQITAVMTRLNDLTKKRTESAQ